MNTRLTFEAFLNQQENTTEYNFRMQLNPLKNSDLCKNTYIFVALNLEKSNSYQG